MRLDPGGVAPALWWDRAPRLWSMAPRLARRNSAPKSPSKSPLRCRLSARRKANSGGLFARSLWTPECNACCPRPCAGFRDKPDSIGFYAIPGFFFCTNPGALCFQASLSVCSHVVIRRVVGTGLFLGLSTTEESRRLHQAMGEPAGVPRAGRAEKGKGPRSPSASLPKRIAFSC